MAGFCTPILALCRSAALKMENCSRPASDRVIAKDAKAVLEKICRALRRGGEGKRGYE